MDGPALVSGRVTMGKWRLANWRIGGAENNAVHGRRLGVLERLARLASIEVHQRVKHFQACPLLQASRGSGRGTLDFGPSTRSRNPGNQKLRDSKGRLAGVDMPGCF
jgi:hypothetical protein